MENKVLEGPKNDLDGFLAAVDQLHTNVEYLTMNRSFKASDSALSHARELFSEGMTRLEAEFKALLTQHRSVLLRASSRKLLRLGANRLSLSILMVLRMIYTQPYELIMLVGSSQSLQLPYMMKGVIQNSVNDTQRVTIARGHAGFIYIELGPKQSESG